MSENKWIGPICEKTKGTNKTVFKLQCHQPEPYTDKIAIVDIETDGLDPKNNIVEIGIYELDLKTGKTRILFDSVVKDLGVIDCDAWIFKNSDLTVEEVLAAPDLNCFKFALQRIFDTYYITAYNTQFDFGFLESRYLRIPHKLDDPMLVATDICKIENYYGYKWPKFEEAYDHYFPDESMDTPHRAAKGAELEAKLVYEMYKRGDMKIDIKPVEKTNTDHDKWAEEYEKGFRKDVEREE